jgi:hypothetical protein
MTAASRGNPNRAVLKRILSPFALLIIRFTVGLLETEVQFWQPVMVAQLGKLN